MDKKQFVLDTLLPYFNDLTSCAVENDSCVYRAKNGNKCALGKHIRDDAYSPSMENVAGTILLEKYPDCLTDEAKEMQFTEYVWAMIQGVHDSLAIFGLQYNHLLYKITNLENALNISLPELKAFIKA